MMFFVAVKCNSQVKTIFMHRLETLGKPGFLGDKAV
jgi:hypothetical protein